MKELTEDEKWNIERDKRYPKNETTVILPEFLELHKKIRIAREQCEKIAKWLDGKG